MLGGVLTSPTHRVCLFVNQDNEARILLDALSDNSIAIVDKMDRLLGRTSRVEINSCSCQIQRFSKASFIFNARICRRFKQEVAVPDAVKKEYESFSAEKTIDGICALIRKRMSDINMTNAALAAKLRLSEDETNAM